MRAYAENRSNYPKAVQELQDADPPNATIFNTPHEGNIDRTAHLAWRMLNAAGSFPRGLTNWPFSPATPTSLVTWDPYKARWLIGRNGTQTLYTSTDDGTFLLIGTGTLSFDIDAIAVRPTDGLISVVMSAGGTSANIATLDAATETWHLVTGPNFDTSGVPGALWFAGGGGVFVVWETRPSNPMRVHWSTNGSAYTGDVAVGQFPTTFGQGTPVIFPAASPTLLLFFSTSTIGLTTYMSSVDGNVWNQQTMPTLASGEGIVGACYNAELGLFFFQTFNSSTVITKLYSSPTGLAGTWTAVTSSAPRAYITQELACLNVTRGPYAGASVLATLAWPWATIITGAPWRLLLSADGGQTWQLSNLLGNLGRLTAGDSKIFYTDNGHSQFAVSAPCGPLPDLLL